MSIVVVLPLGVYEGLASEAVCAASVRDRVNRQTEWRSRASCWAASGCVAGKEERS